MHTPTHAYAYSHTPSYTCIDFPCICVMCHFYNTVAILLGKPFLSAIVVAYHKIINDYAVTASTTSERSCRHYRPGAFL